MTTNDKSTSKNNTILNYIPALFIVAGISLFYSLHLDLWMRWSIVFVTILAAIAIFFFLSPTGVRLHSYIRESWLELGKVVWPTRKETMQFTWIVFILVVLLGLFLWLVDTSLSWLFYSVILKKG